MESIQEFKDFLARDIIKDNVLVISSGSFASEVLSFIKN